MNNSKKIIMGIIASSMTLTAMVLPYPNNNQKKQVTNSIIIPNILTNKIEDIKPTIFIKRTGPTIQLAILLDTSGSMNGLINQTRTHIWKIINELGEANLNNKDVSIQVSLYEYGKASISSNEGFLKKLVPFTKDLDHLSSELFSLNTNGGDEFSGRVILSSINELNWSNHPKDLKLIVIAGNESFTQGNVDYRYAIEKAKEKNISVSTIFCGDYNSGVNLSWKNAADLGGGKYMNINQDHKNIVYRTEYDDEIQFLGRELNKTYVGVGKYGKEKKRMQIQQDTNSESISSSNSIERSIAKSSKQYDSSSWDMVSMFKSDSKKAMKTISTSEEYSGLSKKEIVSKIESKSKDRKKISNLIQSLKEKREKEIIMQKNKMGNSSIGDDIINNIKSIAKENGFKF